jgi:hypothetical protein
MRWWPVIIVRLYVLLERLANVTPRSVCYWRPSSSAPFNPIPASIALIQPSTRLGNTYYVIVYTTGAAYLEKKELEEPFPRWLHRRQDPSRQPLADHVQISMFTHKSLIPNSESPTPGNYELTRRHTGFVIDITGHRSLPPPFFFFFFFSFSPFIWMGLLAQPLSSERCLYLSTCRQKKQTKEKRLV